MSVKYGVYKTRMNDDLFGCNGSSYYVKRISRGLCTCDELCKDIADKTTYNRATVLGVLDAVAHEVVLQLQAGLDVELSRLCTISMQLGYDSPIEDSQLVMNNHVQLKRLVFRPSKELIRRLITTKYERSFDVSHVESSPTERQQTICKLIDTYSMVTRRLVSEANACARNTALNDLNEMISQGVIKRIGWGDKIYYMKA